MRRFLLSLLRQKNIGDWWGGIKFVSSQVSLYVTVLNLVLLTITAYYTSISPWLHGRAIAIPFWVFILSIVALLAVVMVIEYKMSLPSFFSFWNSQFYQHGNELRTDIEALQKGINRINKRNKPYKS